MGWFIVFLVAFVAVSGILIRVGRNNAKKDRKVSKVYGTSIYLEACNLEYFTRNCTFNPGNKKYIEDKLKEYRARDEMEDVVFNNKVGDIGLIFERRCKDVESKD
jgi:hypothetical protein